MRLPAFEDLSKEQDLIYNLELDGNYLVSGPPGTGKSVMALYRAQVLTFDDREPDVLMYSNVLRQYTASAAAEVGIEGRVSTFHSWFDAFWQKHYGKKPPAHAGDSYSYDWEEVPQQFLKKMPDIGTLHDLLVDEGQDLPLGFYRMSSVPGEEHHRVRRREPAALRTEHNAQRDLDGDRGRRVS